jgi:hypothetical protein
MKQITKKPIKNWDAGAVVEIDLNWDCEDYIISAKEVVDNFKKHVEKWAGIKKFKLTKKPNVKIKFIR